MKVGLRFLLEGGHFIDVVSTEAETTAIISDWKNGSLNDKKRISGEDVAEKRLWAVELGRVLGIITFGVVENTPREQKIADSKHLPPGTSGMYN